MSNLTCKVYENKGNKVKVYFSYAKIIGIDMGNEYYITSEKYSVTTSKHTSFVQKNFPLNYTQKVNERKLNNLYAKMLPSSKILKTESVKTR